MLSIKTITVYKLHMQPYIVIQDTALRLNHVTSFYWEARTLTIEMLNGTYHHFWFDDNETLQEILPVLLSGYFPPLST